MIAVREILCATDVENPTHAGLRFSFFLADHFQCSLHVVHACPKIESVRPNSYLSGAERMEHVLVTHRLRERLDALVRAVPGASGRATTHVVDGKSTGAVLSCSGRLRADLIVIGSAAHEAPRAGHLQSIEVGLTEQAPCPVLTVPPRETGVPPRLKRIALAVDAAPAIGRAVEWAAYFARRFGAAVQLIYQQKSVRNAGETEAMHRYEVEDRLRREGVAVDSTCVERPSRLTEHVIELVGRGACDLVVIGAVVRDDALESLRRAAVLPVLSVRDFTPDRQFVESSFDERDGSVAGAAGSTQ